MLPYRQDSICKGLGIIQDSVEEMAVNIVDPFMEGTVNAQGGVQALAKGGTTSPDDVHGRFLV